MKKFAENFFESGCKAYSFDEMDTEIELSVSKNGVFCSRFSNNVNEFQRQFKRRNPKMPATSKRKRKGRLESLPRKKKSIPSCKSNKPNKNAVLPHFLVYKEINNDFLLTIFNFK